MKAPEEDRRMDGETMQAKPGGSCTDSRTTWDWRTSSPSAGARLGLMRMRSLGLPVPEGFVVTTEACVFYIETGEMPEGLLEEVKENLQRVEEATGRGFGDPREPSAGLGEERRGGLHAGDDGYRTEPRSERRHRQRPGRSTGRTLRPGLLPALHPGVRGDCAEDAGHLFEDAIEEMKRDRGVEADTELSAGDLKELMARFKEIVSQEAEYGGPGGPGRSVRAGDRAVFDSWLGGRPSLPQGVASRTL